MNDNSASILNQQLSNTEDGKQFVTFTVEDEEFGVEILKVHEIIGYMEPTHVPNVPEFIKGVVNLRGVIIPIIDLRKKFHMEDKEYSKFTVIVVVEVATKIVGLIVDAVSDVLTLTEDAIQEVPDFNKFKSEYLKGMGKAEEKLVLILNVDKLLTYDEYKQLHQIND